MCYLCSWHKVLPMFSGSTVVGVDRCVHPSAASMHLTLSYLDRTTSARVARAAFRLVETCLLATLLTVSRQPRPNPPPQDQPPRGRGPDTRRDPFSNRRHAPRHADPVAADRRRSRLPHRQDPNPASRGPRWFRLLRPSNARRAEMVLHGRASGALPRAVRAVGDPGGKSRRLGDRCRLVQRLGW